jgi:hypothetical protein
MALIECPECKKQVSSEARACPYCGYPVAEKVNLEETPADHAVVVAPQPTELLREVRPSWWGYFWHLFFFWLIIPPIVAWFKRASVVMRVFPERVTIERGIFSKCYQDYRPRDIRSIDIDQSFLDRMVGVGDITISTSATVDAAELIKGIPDPMGLRDLILAQQKNV